MTLRIVGYIVGLCLLLFPSAMLADTFYPLGHRIFDLEYDLLFHHGVARQDMTCLSPVGPYPFDVMATAISADRMPLRALFDAAPDREFQGVDGTNPSDRLRLLAVGAQRFRGMRDHRPDNLPFVMGGAVYHPGRYFGALVFFSLDRAKAVDPYYTGKRYRGLAGDVETAALTFRKDKVAVTLGRQRVFWGPRRVNLLISETSEPFDLLSASYRAGRFAFSFLFARLDQSRPDGTDSLRFPDLTFNDNRYLVGHRLDVTIHRRFRLGLFETVLFGGEGRPPELYYLNPLQFFHAAQLNENEDDNTILGFDFTLLPGKGLSSYGQVIVDDVQIDDKSPGDKEPAEYGFLLGLCKAGRIKSAVPDITLEYARLTNRTYHQRDPRNRYLYRNRLIGHPLGPDADSLSIAVRFWPDESFFAEAEFAYRRKGEGSIYQPWDEPWLFATGDFDEPFPTGVIEKTALTAVRLNGYLPFTRYLRNHLFVSFEAGWGEIHNYRNIQGQVATTAWFNVGVNWLGLTDASVD